MSILSVNSIDRAEWSQLVKTSATGTWFQTPEAYDFYASLPELFRPFVIGVASPQPSPAGKGAMSALGTFASVWGAHTADSTQYSILKENAQGNRKNPTEAESILWAMLKGNNLGLHFRRQHIILDYIVDFICLEKGLVIELDGGYHNNLEQAEYDKQRTTHLQKLGYTELRFTNEELLTNPDAVIAQIKCVASSLPSLQGGGGGRLYLRAVCVGFATKERNALKQFFTRRAIILGGPCLADDCTDEEVMALLCALKSTLLSGRDGVGFQPIYIETRNFNDYSRWKGAFERIGFAYRPHLNFHVDCTDKAKMWERLSENRKRQIRKQPSQTLSDVDEAKIREWYNVLQELYRTKVKTPLWPLEFFLEAYRQGIGQFILTQYKGKVIGGSMVVTDGKCVYEWFECGMNGEYKEQYPSVMATWDGIQWAHMSGCQRYDMMGAGEPGVPYGVRDFKSEFGGTLVEHGRFLYVCKPLLYKIGVAGVRILKVFKSEGV